MAGNHYTQANQGSLDSPKSYLRTRQDSIWQILKNVFQSSNAPSDEERRRRSTHTPYREWWNIVSVRARSDRGVLMTGVPTPSSASISRRTPAEATKMRTYVVWLLMIQRLSGLKRGRFRASGGTASQNFMAVEATKLLSYLGHRRVTLHGPCSCYPGPEASDWHGNAHRINSGGEHQKQPHRGRRGAHPSACWNDPRRT